MRSATAAPRPRRPTRPPRGTPSRTCRSRWGLRAAPRQEESQALLGAAGEGGARLQTPGRYDVVFDDARVDPDVQKVLRRLVRNGHEAYLVGGGVRDLLLDRRPKDFDVATSARPEE